MHLLLLTLPRAFALDTGSNDSCTSYEMLSGLVTVGDGSLSASSDVDAFRANGVPPGVLNVALLNRSNASDDFLLQLYDASGTTLLASDAMSDGLATINYTNPTAAPYCIRVSGSEGATS